MNINDVLRLKTR